MKEEKPRTLLDVCELIVDCEHKTAPTQSTGYPSIRTPNVGRGRLILDNVNRVSQGTYNEWTRREVPRSGDLILAREAPAGNIAMIPKDLEVCLGQRTVLIRANNDLIDASYLLYLLLDDKMQAKLLSFGSGATVAHVNMSDIRALQLPDLPLLEKQKRIGEILSAYDDLIENNTRRIKILEEMAKLIYREWFVEFKAPGVRLRKATAEEKKVTGKEVFPEGWEVRECGELMTVDKGLSYNGRGLTGGGIPMVNLKNFLVGGGFRRDGTKAYSGEYRPNHEVKAQDIIIANTDLTQAGNVVGSPALIPEGIFDGKVIITHHLFAVRRRDPRALPVHYLYHILLTNEFKWFAKSYASGTTVLGLPREGVLKFRFAYGSEAARNEFEEEVKPMYSLIDLLNKQNDSLRQTRDLLLPKLVSGQVDA